MKVIFCLTTARSGTKYLSYLFKNNIKNCISKHEPIPTMFGNPINWYQEGETDKIRELFKKKEKKIYGYNTEVYVETNHAFLKSFFEVSMEFFPEMKLVHLIRDPLKMANSGLNRYKQIRKYHYPCYYKGDDGNKYFKWTLTGKEEIYKNFGYDWNTIYYQTDDRKIFEFLILQWIELQNRAIAFLNKYKKHKDCYILAAPKDLNDKNTLKNMFNFFDLELKHEEISLRGRKHKGAKPTIITEEDKNQLNEIISKIPQKYLQIFKNNPYVDFEWAKIFSST